MNENLAFEARSVRSVKLYHEKRYAEAAAMLEPFYAAGTDGIGWYWNDAMYDLACGEALVVIKRRWTF